MFSGGTSSPRASSSATYRSLISSPLMPAALARTAASASSRACEERSASALARSRLGRSSTAPGQEHDSRQARSETINRSLASGQEEWHSHLHSVSPASKRRRRGLNPAPPP